MFFFLFDIDCTSVSLCSHKWIGSCIVFFKSFPHTFIQTPFLSFFPYLSTVRAFYYIQYLTQR